MTTRTGLNYVLNLQDQSFGRTIGTAERQVGSLDNKINGLARNIAGAFAANQLYSFAEQATQLKAKMEGYANMVRFASSSNADFAKNQAFINKQISDLKLPLMETTEGYATFLAATKGTSIEGEGARNVLAGLSAAQVTLHMSTEQTQRGLLALNQMISKGTVSSEELRGQLGEAIPGAFNLAAQSIGVTTQQLGKMLEKGEVVSADFLPKFAAKLMEVYGPGMQASINSTQSQLNAVNNEILIQKAAIGEELAPAYIYLQQVQGRGLSIAKDTIHFLKEHQTLVESMAIGYITYRGSLMYAQWAMKGLEAATTLTNTAMKASPAGWVAMGLAALTATVYGLTKETDNLALAIRDRAVTSLQAEKMQLEDTLVSLERGTLGHEELTQTYDRLAAKYPEVFGNLSQEAASIDVVTAKLRELIATYDQKIIKQAQEKLNQRFTDDIASKIEDLQSAKDIIKNEGWSTTTERKKLHQQNVVDIKDEIQTLRKQQVEKNNQLVTNLKEAGLISTNVPASTGLHGPGAVDNTGKINNLAGGKIEVTTPGSTTSNTSTSTPTMPTTVGIIGAGKVGTVGGGITVGGNGGRGGGNTYITTIQTLKAADQIVIERAQQLRVEIERTVNEVLQRALADSRAVE